MKKVVLSYFKPFIIGHLGRTWIQAAITSQFGFAAAYLVLHLWAYGVCAMRIKYRSTDTAACSDGVNFAMAGAAAISAVWGFSAVKYQMKLARIQQKQDSPQIKKLVGETEEWTCILSLMHFLSLAVYLCFSAAALLVTAQNDRSINSWVGWQEESTNLDSDRSTQARNILIVVFTIINLLHAVFISTFIYLRITFFNVQIRLFDKRSSTDFKNK